MSTLRKLEKVVRILREVDTKLPLQHVHFLLIVEREMPNGGANYADLERGLNTTMATVSRITKYLGSYIVPNSKTGKDEKVGKGWVDVRRDQYQAKYLTVVLTKEGQKFCDKLKATLS